ncbi:MAG: hypothetical protein K0S23_922 [Fluviicola sp.]|jgi:hypothetical protein|uniref:hypothetical protein n=1 Tax=Fluviicola sp. TaxID=1917219 RepID=UPI002617342B|nr:hypothetical protein [Fluviicola sp.]MDF3026615.1 hypothetical protein [Fluviicola sp.]
MEINKEQLLQLKSGENEYKQFYIDKNYDHSESIFEHIQQTVDLLIKEIDNNTPVEELHAFLRKRFLKMGWHKFLEDMEYVRPNDPENKLHDAVNKSYYDRMAQAVGLDNFLEYAIKPSKRAASSAKSNHDLSKLDELEEFHGKEMVQQIKKAFEECLREIDSMKDSALEKELVIQHFKKLLDFITDDLDVYDTDDREAIAEVVEDCLIKYGFSDSDGMLGKYV